MTDQPTWQLAKEIGRAIWMWVRIAPPHREVLNPIRPGTFERITAQVTEPVNSYLTHLVGIDGSPVVAKAEKVELIGFFADERTVEPQGLVAWKAAGCRPADFAELGALECVKAYVPSR